MSERRRLVFLLLGAFIMRFAFAGSTPPYQAPDERAHVGFVEYVGENGALPRQPEKRLDLFGDPMHQAYQPPLAYLCYVPLDRALAAAGVERPARTRALRLQNALYGVLTVLVGFVVVSRLTRPGDPRRLLAPMVLALLPGFIGVTSVVNNDGLAMLLASVLWLGWCGPGRAPAWRQGLVFGAGCATKLTLLALAPLLLLGPLWLRRDDLRVAAREAAVAGAVAALVLAPWIAHNLSVYGAPLAIDHGSLGFAWLETQLPPETVAEALRPRPENTFFQFFGRFGIANNLSFSPVAWFGAAVVLLALAGWLRAAAARPLDTLERAGGVFGAALALTLAGLLWFSLSYAGGWQGRYLYGAALPTSALLAAGLTRSLPESVALWILRATGAALLLLDGALLVALRRFYATTPAAEWILPGVL